MRLEKTKQFMEQCVGENLLDTYAIRVGINGGECDIYSDNANSETYFDIASMGKVLVTSTLILRAVSENRLSLDDTLPKFFDKVPEDKENITVRQLLEHTSGIVRTRTPEGVIEDGADSFSQFILSCPLAFLPGTDYAYSCYGYVMLGFILEKVYNMSLDKLFYKYTKRNLGLEYADFNIPTDTENMAISYYRSEVLDCAVADDIAYRMKGVAGNGCSFWNIIDLDKYIKAVLAKEAGLYPKELFDMAETDYTPSFAEGRGLGYIVVDERYKQTGELFSRGSFGHCGNTGTSFFIDRKTGLYVIILTNATRFNYMKYDYKSLDYSVIMQLREDIHNRIKQDLM